MTGLNHVSLKKRLISAGIIAPPCLLIIWFGGLVFQLMVLVFLGLALWEWLKMARNIDPMNRPAFILFGMVYILICFLSFLALGHPDWSRAAFVLLLIVAASDTGAYFAGKLIGGARIMVAISPNKTWAGLGGAIAGGVLVALACLALGLHMQTAQFAILAGIVTALSGQVGDFTISWGKRLAGVKDTGYLLPGHGGILDRIDSLMLSAPVFIIITLLAGHG